MFEMSGGGTRISMVGVRMPTLISCSAKAVTPLSSVTVSLARNVPEEA